MILPRYNINPVKDTYKKEGYRLVTNFDSSQIRTYELSIQLYVILNDIDPDLLKVCMSSNSIADNGLWIKESVGMMELGEFWKIFDGERYK